MAIIPNLKCVQSTDLALLVTETRRYEKTTKEEWRCWVPKSQILFSSDVREKDTMGSLHVTDWFYYESDDAPEKFADLQKRRDARAKVAAKKTETHRETLAKETPMALNLARKNSDLVQDRDHWKKEYDRAAAQVQELLHLKDEKASWHARRPWAVYLLECLRFQYASDFRLRMFVEVILCLVKDETFDFLTFLAHGGFPLPQAVPQETAGPKKGEVWEMALVYRSEKGPYPRVQVVILKEFEDVSALWGEPPHGKGDLWVHNYPFGPSYMISRTEWKAGSPKKLANDIPEMEALTPGGQTS